MNSPDATVILKAADGAWTTLGTEESRGIIPEGITTTANEFGPDTASFSLRREASVPYPDLLAYNQCEILIGGTLMWGGRVWEAPLSDSSEDVISVQGRGWQYHLDDDMLLRSYVLTDMTRFVPSWSKVTAVIGPGTLPMGAKVETGNGMISLIFPNGFATVPSDTVGVTLDLGSALIKRVVVTWARVGISDGNTTFYLRTSTHEYVHDGAATIDDTAVALTTASATTTLTAAAPRRYLHLFVFRSAGSGTWTVDEGVKITSVQVFSDTAYESGNASILKASDVVKDMVASTANWQLSTATDNIATSAFSIPELAPQGYQTMRQLITAANAYEGNLFGVDAQRKVFYRERSDYPDVEVGSWPGASFQDASTNSGEGLYNRVFVQGTGPDGAPVQQQAITGGLGLLDRQGFRRTAIVSVESAITTTGAGQIAGIWLNERTNPPLKGSLVLSGWGGARYLNGGDVHPSEMMLRYGQKIRLGQLVDPTTGDQGRDGIIKSVSYAHDTETATLELDSERGRLETLLSRLAVVTSQIR